MTWTEWVNSSYNTDGYYINYGAVMYDYDTVGYVRCGSVGVDDAIQANRDYVLFDLGTCSGGGDN